jgi:hypothetical protein
LRDDSGRVHRLGLAGGGPAGGARVGAVAEFAAGAFGLVEQVSGERDALADGAAEEVADGTTDRLADQVEARDLDRAEHVRQPPLVPRLLAARLAPFAAEPLLEALGDRVERERVAADDEVASLPEGRVHAGAAGNLADAGDVVGRHELDDRPQRVRRVHPRRVEQRRIRHRDRRDPHLRDPHPTALARSHVRPTFARARDDTGRSPLPVPPGEG